LQKSRSQACGSRKQKEITHLKTQTRRRQNGNGQELSVSL
jgi:hypothetical protein